MPSGFITEKATDSLAEQDSSAFLDSIPNRGTIRVSKDALDVEVKYRASDSVVFDVRNKKVYLYGEALVEYGEMILGAAYMEIDFELKELRAKGRIDSAGKYVDLPVFKDGDREVGADTMIYNFASKRGKMQGLKLQEGEGIILCNRVFRDSTGEIYTDLGKYTTCNHDPPHFYLNARKLKIIPDNKIIFGPANLVIEEVPLPAYLPFGIFPTKKGQTSGLVFPQYGLSANRGYNLTQGGYYFHISDYIDQAITGDFYFRGSWGLRSDTRYAKKYKYTGALNLGYAYNIFGEKGLPDYRVSPDFKVGWLHTQDAKARPGTGFSADVNIVSGQYNLNNSFDAEQIVASQFRSTVSYSKMMTVLGQPSNLRIGMNHNQNTQTKEFDMDLPNLNFDVNRFAPFKSKKSVGTPNWYENIQMSYSTNFSNRLQTYDTLLNSPEILNDFKYGMIHTVPVNTSVKFLKNYFTFNPSFNYTEYWYMKSTRKTFNEAENRVETFEVDGFERASAYSANANITTRIFGTFKFKKSPKIEAIRHVITPNLNFSYRPDFSSDRFNYYRTVQSDSFGNTQRYSIFEQGIKGGPGTGQQGMIGFSLINNLELKKLVKTDTSSDFAYVKILESFNIDGNYNFLADSFKFSTLRFSMRTVLFEKLSLQLNGNMDLYAYENDRRVDRLQITENGNLGKWQSADLIASYALNPEANKNGRPSYTPPPGVMLTDQEWRNVTMYPHNYVDFNVLWNVNLNYSLRYSDNQNVKKIDNLLNFSGDISLTENWKISVTSGYDFTQKQIAYTSVDLIRDLHCWQFNFNWIPLGERKSFFFVLRAKSSMLQDLKLNKRGFWFDR